MGSVRSEANRLDFVLAQRAASEGPRCTRAVKPNRLTSRRWELSYFPNAFFNSGSSSPFFSIGSKISVSP